MLCNMAKKSSFGIYFQILSLHVELTNCSVSHEDCRYKKEERLAAYWSALAHIYLAIINLLTSSIYILQ